MDDFTLSGAQRGYKQAGKKLLPRDAYAANLAEHAGGRNARARKREAALEAAAYGKQADSAIERKVWRCHNALSARRLKACDGVLERAFLANEIDCYLTKPNKPLIGVGMGRAQCRYIAAVAEDYYTQLAIEADDRLLRYAR